MLEPLIAGKLLVDTILFLDQRLGLLGPIPEAGLGRFFQ